MTICHAIPYTVFRWSIFSIRASGYSGCCYTRTRHTLFWLSTGSNALWILVFFCRSFKKCRRTAVKIAHDSPLGSKIRIVNHRTAIGSPAVTFVEPKMSWTWRKSYFLINVGGLGNWNIISLLPSPRRCACVVCVRANREPDNINSLCPAHNHIFASRCVNVLPCKKCSTAPPSRRAQRAQPRGKQRKYENSWRSNHSFHLCFLLPSNSTLCVCAAPRSQALPFILHRHWLVFYCTYSARPVYFINFYCVSLSWFHVFGIHK